MKCPVCKGELSKIDDVFVSGCIALGWEEIK
jgi:hypothetical protein